MSLCPVILAGGGGTRLWPLSRAYYPKQFLRLWGEHSMLQETLLRLDHMEPNISQLAPVLVCNEGHRFLVADQVEQINQSLRSIILEPEGRGTAPALTVAAQALMEQGEDPVMVMMPADHVITDLPRFRQVIETGYRLANQDFLITFGIKPASAETGYGYIQCGETLDEQHGISKIVEFKEKPSPELAQAYLEDGGYLWNSGIFMMKGSIWCREMMRLQPDIYAACLEAYAKGHIDKAFYRLDKAPFLHCRNDSIDYAVMEHVTHEPNVLSAVVSLDAGWSDIGAWSAVWALGEQDEEGNVITGDVMQKDTHNSLLRAEHKLVVTLGCDNLVVVETADVVLVANKERAQDVKGFMSILAEEKREERLLHRRVFRPWGYYETVDTGECFQVKRITVDPGKKLSLQRHYRRAEHWIVVKGTATVTKDEAVFLLGENESTYIPIATKHRLENATEKPLELIEVQSGSYLGEDDIERFEDDFGR